MLKLLKRSARDTGLLRGVSIDGQRETLLRGLGLTHALCILSMAENATAAPYQPADGSNLVHKIQEASVRPTVTQSAEDAFGARVGEDIIGLYSETEVRGFDLQSAGNYRLDGAYFARAVAARDPIVASTAIRVGINASRFEFPSPSGVVDHRLRRAEGPENSLLIRAGSRDYESPFVELFGQRGNPDAKLRLAGGFQAQPANRFGNGATGDFYAVGIVPEMKFGRFDVSAPISFSRAYLDADYAFLAAGDSLPPQTSFRRYPAPTWARFEGTGVNGGLLMDGETHGPWSVRASIVLSQLNVSKSDFTLFSNLAQDGTAEALTIRGFPREVTALASEVRFTRDLTLLGQPHAITFMARHRNTASVYGLGTAVDSGRVDLLNPIYSQEPSLSAPEPGQDDVEQTTFGLAYRAQFSSWLEVRGGGQKTHYHKQVTLPGEPTRSSISDPWLANASAVALVNSRITGFASYVRGLEETGVAPQTASNRNAILPAALATQYEVGLRYQLRPRLGAIVSGFRIEKPYASFDGTGAYGLNGTVRHSGLELSLTGQVTDQVTVVVGALLMQPRRSENIVQAEVSGDRPVGVSSIRGLFSAEVRPMKTSELYLSADVTYHGARAANRTNTLTSPGYLLTNLGARYPIEMRGVKYTIRTRVSNLLDEQAWIALPSETLTRVGPRTIRFSLERQF